MSVTCRVGQSNAVAWLKRDAKELRKCERWCCDTCEKEYILRKPYLIIQTQSTNARGWKDYFSVDLGANTLSVVHRMLPRISRGDNVSDDCIAWG